MMSMGTVLWPCSSSGAPGGGSSGGSRKEAAPSGAALAIPALVVRVVAVACATGGRLMVCLVGTLLKLRSLAGARVELAHRQ
jgi:hypothetical protein